MKIYLANTAFINLSDAQKAFMKIYLADTSTTPDTALALKSETVKQQLAGQQFRILLSYHYFKSMDLDKMMAKYFEEPYPQVFLDSGAFSAFTQGETIDLAEYCQYIKKYRHLLTVFSNLDAIGDAATTLANQRRMEDRGLSPLPVFHTGEDWSYLEGYIEQYPYIALGGMVPYFRDKKVRRELIKWLIRCFKLADGKSVYHGFGCTTWEVMKALPWYSVDSSSWISGARFGSNTLFDTRAGCFQPLHIGDKKECYRLASLIRDHGFDPSDFADRSKNTRPKNCGVSALAFLRAERWLERRFGPINLPERNICHDIN